jgi:hypothetical protein
MEVTCGACRPVWALRVSTRVWAVQVIGGVFGVDPHLDLATNEQLFRWQWRRARVYEAARRILIEAISRNKTAGGFASTRIHVAVPLCPAV